MIEPEKTILVEAKAYVVQCRTGQQSLQMIFKGETLEVPQRLSL